MSVCMHDVYRMHFFQMKTMTSHACMRACVHACIEASKETCKCPNREMSHERFGSKNIIVIVQVSIQIVEGNEP